MILFLERLRNELPNLEFSLMRKLLLIFPVVVLLTGCPGKDGLKMGKHRPVYVDGQRICFTKDKQEVLTRYLLTTNVISDTVLLSGPSVQLSYPDTCFKVDLKKAVMYDVSYAVNGKNYYYTFIIDNEGHVLTLGR